MVIFIYVIRSLIKCIWSVFRRYGHTTFEILLYYMVNNRVIWSYIRYIWLYIRYIWSFYKGNMVINEVYMVNI